MGITIEGMGLMCDRMPMERAGGRAGNRPTRRKASGPGAEGKGKTSDRILSAKLLGGRPWLVHGFSTRQRGHSTIFGGKDLNLGYTANDSASLVAKNRQAFLRDLGFKGNQELLCVKQVHSGIVHLIGEAPGGSLAGDGLVTATPGVLLAIQTADCVPVLVADVRKRIVGAFHAGWRGTVRRIVERGIGLMRVRFGSDPADLRAAIGPCIQTCCYAVGSEVVEEFESQFAYSKELFSEVYDEDPVKKKYPMLFLTARAPGHSNIGPQIHLDLSLANRRQLMDAGIKPKDIEMSGLCTSCQPQLFFSYRAEHGFTGRMLSVIGIREK